jgi:heme oxygenase
MQAMAKHSKYQEKVIKNYYQNREAISLQRLQELVTELYLSEGKQREKHWKSIIGHLEKMGVKQEQIDHLVAKDKPELVAQLVQDLLEKQ